MKSDRRILQISVILLIVLSCSGIVAAAFPERQGFVNDFANVIDRKSAAELQILGEKLWKEQGIGLAVVTISTTSPLDPKEYTTKLFNEWGVGGPDDSGLLMLLALAEGAIEVEPGYGLEGTLPDGLVGAVIDQEGMPHFKNRAYAAGLTAMAAAYANILAGEQFEIVKEKDGGSGWFASFVIFVLLILLMRRGRRYPPGGSGRIGGGGSGRTIVMPRTPSSGGSRPSGGFGGGRSGGGGAGRRF